MQAFDTTNELVNKIVYVPADGTIAIQTAASIFNGFGDDITSLIRSNYAKAKAHARALLLETGGDAAQLVDCDEAAMFNGPGSTHAVFSSKNVVKVWLFQAEEKEE